MISEKLAKDHFESFFLPRRLWDIRQNSYRKVLDGDKERGELYPLFEDIVDSTADFGVGIGAFFADLILLVICLTVCGFIVAPVMHYFNTASYGTEDHTWATAACTYTTNITATVNCPNNAESCMVRMADNCVLGEVVIICDVIMCFFLIGFIFLSIFIQKKIVAKLDESVQTIQDYSIEVMDPTQDATNPDEWMRYFSRFGKVRYVTVTKSNRQLIQLLFKKKQLLYRLKCHLMKENKNKLPPVLLSSSSSSSPVKMSKSAISSSAAPVITWDKTKDKNIKNVEDAYYNSNPKYKDQLTCWPRIKLMIGLVDTHQDVVNQLDKLEIQLTTAFKETYTACRVYVTFEREEYQRLALQTLEVPDFFALIDSSFHAKTVNAFRGENILNVHESDEPDTILWDNTEVSLKQKYLMAVIVGICILGILIACYIAIDQMQQINTTMTPLLVAAIDSFLPPLFDALTALETKDSESKRQKQLHKRLFMARLLVSTIFPYVSTSWNEFLSTEKINSIIYTQLLTCLFSPIFTITDSAGLVKRHITAHLIATNQFEFNSYWDGQSWALAERYVEIAKILFIIFFYTLLTPGSLFIGAISFLLIFLLDRYALLRRWKSSPMMDISVCKVLKKEIMLAIAVHMYVSCRWIYSWPMDSAVIISSDNSSGGNSTSTTSSSSGSGSVVYGYVDKQPSIWIVDLTPQSEWMSDDQLKWIKPYIALTILALLIALYTWVIEGIAYIFRNLFFVHISSGGKASTQLFSELEGVQTYTPVFIHGANRYIIADTKDMLPRHLDALIRYHQVDSCFDIVDLVPIQHRKHILDVIKWYDHGDPEKAVADMMIDNNTDGVINNTSFIALATPPSSSSSYSPVKNSNNNIPYTPFDINKTTSQSDERAYQTLDDLLQPRVVKASQRYANTNRANKTNQAVIINDNFYPNNNNNNNSNRLMNSKNQSAIILPPLSSSSSFSPSNFSSVSLSSTNNTSSATAFQMSLNPSQQQQQQQRLRKQQSSNNKSKRTVVPYDD